MKMTIGYIGVITVTIEKNSWDDKAFVTGEDSAHEVGGFEYDAPTLLAAWRRAAREITKRGGVVLHNPPASNKRFLTVAVTSDLPHCIQVGEATLDKAVAGFDKKMHELEDDLCKGWTKKTSYMSVTYTDVSGYQVNLRLYEARAFREAFSATYL